MSRTGKQFLRRTTFSHDQIGGITGSNAHNLRGHAADRLRGADDLSEYGRREDVIVEGMGCFLIEVS